LLALPEALDAAVLIQSRFRGKLVRSKGDAKTAGKKKAGWAKLDGQLQSGNGNTSDVPEMDLPDMLEWHRDEKYFTDFALKTIVAKATRAQPFHCRKAERVEQLRMGDEAPFSVAVSVYLLPEYSQLRALTKPGMNLFEELETAFTTRGIEVLQEPAPDAATVVLVSPELYERPEIAVKVAVRLEKLTGSADGQKRRKSSMLGGQRKASLLKRSPTISLKRAPTMSSLKRQGTTALKRQGTTRLSVARKSTRFLERTGEDDTEPPIVLKLAGIGDGSLIRAADGSLWMGLFSTSNTPSWYANRCPSRLKALLSTFVFAKWPVSPALQDVAVAEVGRTLAEAQRAKARRGTVQHRPSLLPTSVSLDKQEPASAQRLDTLVHAPATGQLSKIRESETEEDSVEGKHLAQRKRAHV
jgi:hypothetical protein